MISSWVEFTKLFTKIGDSTEELPQKITIERAHLRDDSQYSVSVRPPFRCGDFSILAAKFQGKNNVDSHNLPRRHNSFE